MNPKNYLRKPKVIQETTVEFCKSAALVSILFSMYSGRRFAMPDLSRVSKAEETEAMAPVYREWAKMSYEVAEWCRSPVIRLSNIYTVIPAYFLVEGTRGTEYILGMELMCGEIVSLGRIMGVVVHERSIDLVLTSSMVSVMLPREMEEEYDVLHWMTVYLDARGLNLALPMLSLDDVSAEMTRFLSETAMVYNIDGRPLTARALSNLIGCQITDVEFALNSAGFEKMKRILTERPFQAGRMNIGKEELLLYAYVHAKVQDVSAKTGIPEANLRVHSRLDTKEKDCGLLTDEWGRLYVCDGIARSLDFWAYRMNRTRGALAQTWEAGITEDEWKELSAKVGTPFDMNEEFSRTRHVWVVI